MLKKIFFSLGLIFCLNLLVAQTDSQPKDIQLSYSIEFPTIIVQKVKSEIKIIPDQAINVKPEVKLNDKVVEVQLKDGELILPYQFDQKEELTISIGTFEERKEVTPIPLWMSVLPPLIAIMMALLIREVFSALFLGILVGTTIIFYYQGSTFFIAIFQGIFAIIDTYILESMTDPGHLSIILFSMLII